MVSTRKSSQSFEIVSRSCGDKNHHKRLVVLVGVGDHHKIVQKFSTKITTKAKYFWDFLVMQVNRNLNKNIGKNLSKHLSKEVRERELPSRISRVYECVRESKQACTSFYRPRGGSPLVRPKALVRPNQAGWPGHSRVSDAPPLL